MCLSLLFGFFIFHHSMLYSHRESHLKTYHECYNNINQHHVTMLLGLPPTQFYFSLRPINPISGNTFDAKRK